MWEVCRDCEHRCHCCKEFIIKCDGCEEKSYGNFSPFLWINNCPKDGSPLLRLKDDIEIYKNK